jgi:hypothetical protein
MPAVEPSTASLADVSKPIRHVRFSAETGLRGAIPLMSIFEFLGGRVDRYHFHS